jgi:hypothetical protein
MRELVKSLSSLSWALSLFGARQMLEAVSGPLAGTDPRSGASLGAVTQAAEGTLDGFFRRTFEAGDQMQRSAVDLAFSLASREALEPERIVALSSRFLRQSTSALWSLLPGGEGSSCERPSCGWGPMPPAR